MKVTEFLSSERQTLEAGMATTSAEAPDAYTGTVRVWPQVCCREFLDWLGDGSDIPHDEFPAILRRIAGHNEVHDRGGFTPSFAADLLARWQEQHRHE